jgi:hypothetical protein
MIKTSVDSRVFSMSKRSAFFAAKVCVAVPVAMWFSIGLG